MSYLDRESLSIGNEMQRAAKELPEGWSIQVETNSPERGRFNVHKGETNE